MENITLSIVIGIISSLVATLIFITIAELIRRVALPWYADKIYLGIRIDGEWKMTEFEYNGKIVKIDDVTDYKLLTLKQKGEKITGTYSHKDGNKLEEYILEGKIKDMYFLATAVPKSKRATDGASFLLHVKNINSDLIMKGSVLAQQSQNGEVVSINNMVFKWQNS